MAALATGLSAGTPFALVIREHRLMMRMTPPEQVDQFIGILPQPPDPLRYDYPPTGPQEAHALLSNWIPEGASVLDVGAGTGIFSERLRKTKNANITCIEPDASRAALARERGLTVYTSTVEEFAAASTDHFDIAVLADVVEHLTYPASLLLTVRGLLGKSGRLLVSVPNVAHWTIREALLRGRFDYEVAGLMDATHLRWYTLDSMTRLLSACGYIVEASAGTLGSQHPAYSSRLPWTAIPHRYRSGVLRRLVELFPGAFAQQHVLKARPADDPSCETSAL
jgi:methionine biosynthesis protein MetW